MPLPFDEDRSSKGNRMMRRVLTQVANAAVNAKGSVFQTFYRKLVPRLGHNKAIWAVAHRLCRLIWKILHQGVRSPEGVYLSYDSIANRIYSARPGDSWRRNKRKRRSR
jgi:hypothetical protein